MKDINWYHYKSFVRNSYVLFQYSGKIPFTLASFEAFTAVMFQFEVFWVVTPCSVVIEYQRFRVPCCLHLQGKYVK